VTATIPKPEKPAPAPRRRIGREPKCANCGKRLGDHGGFEGKRCPVAPYEFSTVRNYEPARSSVLRSPAEPRCDDCRHQKASHRLLNRIFSDGCDKCGCLHYTPARPRKLTTARASVARKSAPARTKRKLMPKCKHCAHPAGKHAGSEALELAALFCDRCTACPGYAPAIGIRQKRRTPAAALKLRCDHLWTAIVHARPEMCEVQRFYAHGCEGGPQALHGIPRTFNVTRHLPINGFKGCAGIHLFMTKRPELWSSVLLDAWGEPTFRELWSKARAMEPVDMEATYRALKTEAEQRSIA
jgi:hypothetical protein